jgi:hypothetical protein
VLYTIIRNLEVLLVRVSISGFLLERKWRYFKTVPSAGLYIVLNDGQENVVT